ncbi:hypothetical protein CVT25_002992 [Psilocybe cyanescens]|uniref:Uncharacterized protein n=1 Tax=Psilocybe cyanescens TaxID=93625 RepID=A0A409WMV2_PSICY|nr:hypothetical protein CVT25_002992 [Psilocybe cyanescens]
MFKLIFVLAIFAASQSVLAGPIPQPDTTDTGRMNLRRGISGTADNAAANYYVPFGSGFMGGPVNAAASVVNDAADAAGSVATSALNVGADFTNGVLGTGANLINGVLNAL